MKLAIALATSIALAGCSLAPTRDVASVRELAGQWRGRLALPLANAAATMTIDDNGSYRGALHFQGGEDRPFTGAIVVLRPGRLRYQGSHGNGSVMVQDRGAELTLRFVPDGGGGGGAFTRVR